MNKDKNERLKTTVKIIEKTFEQYKNLWPDDHGIVKKELHFVLDNENEVSTIVRFWVHNHQNNEYQITVLKKEKIAPYKSINLTDSIAEKDLQIIERLMKAITKNRAHVDMWGTLRKV